MLPNMNDIRGIVVESIPIQVMDELHLKGRLKKHNDLIGIDCSVKNQFVGPGSDSVRAVVDREDASGKGLFNLFI